MKIVYKPRWVFGFSKRDLMYYCLAHQKLVTVFQTQSWSLSCTSCTLGSVTLNINDERKKTFSGSSWRGRYAPWRASRSSSGSAMMAQVRRVTQSIVLKFRIFKFLCAADHAKSFLVLFFLLFFLPKPRLRILLLGCKEIERKQSSENEAEKDIMTWTAVQNRDIVKSGYIRLATSDKPEARLKLIVTGFTIFVYDSSCNYLFFGLLARFLSLLM